MRSRTRAHTVRGLARLRARAHAQGGSRRSPRQQLRQRERERAEGGARSPAVAGRGDEIGGAEEGGCEAVARALEDLLGRPALANSTVVHHHQVVGEHQRLVLVMGHQDEGGAEAALQPLELEAHLGPELGVQRRHRLVQQQHVGLVDERASERDALALAARERRDAPLRELGDAQQRERVRHAPRDLGLRRPRARRPNATLPATSRWGKSA